ncbi:Uncharacterized conserved protein [Legionella beliardensis]|uniref:Uncharacterized conserved protein n=1 Tax=Legionella beliardensis TaxID=91822 RepID=A0A378JR49_9GAMM|nr:DUF2235 domain-containing protein [Legionella beliardensis]STX55670.1 Uncharacterized conserved protein [Legionella beliardensis]
MKRIVICCDGTWSFPDKAVNGLSVKTNVAKIASAVLETDADIKQLMFYEPGVGTRGNWFKRAIDAATGSGLSENMLNAYRYLIHNYEPGDELFFFGFSRGAFTVRTLAGMIRNCGILRHNAMDKINKAFELYRSRTKDSHPKSTESTLFRRTYAYSNITPIKFIGVWDTVGALGNPLLLNGIVTKPNSFHDYDLSSTVEYAYHALAINEERWFFQPALWLKDKKDTHQTVEQTWFIGGHCDVGGGALLAGLSDIALTWMAEKAKGAGLRLAQLGTHPDFMQPYSSSRRGIYRLFPAYHRKIGEPVTIVGKERCESLHPSVLER